MNYDKYIKYKKKYIRLINANIQIGGKKNFDINDDDIILFGEGGSSAIIVITKDKKVYKIFTQYNYIPNIKLDEEIKDNNKLYNDEIKIYEMITKNIINNNIANHFVKYINSNEYTNAKSLFKKCSKSYIEFMKLSPDQKTKMCNDYYYKYPDVKLNDKYKVVEIEYCNYSSADFIRDVSKLPEIEMEKYLDIFFFQIIYTIMSVQQIYPYFTHNDLFIRNILGVREKDNGNYYTYIFNDKTYYVPQKKFYPKINDFGRSNLNKDYKNIKLYKSKYKDIYNIIFDVYNGANRGSKSLSELCKDDLDKIKFLKMYFSNYFNVDIIDEFKMKSEKQMNSNFSTILDNEFLKAIEMKKPSDLLNNYFYNIFSKINSKI